MINLPASFDNLPHDEKNMVLNEALKKENIIDSIAIEIKKHIDNITLSNYYSNHKESIY